MDTIDRKVETHEEPQMKVMGHAGGSRTTAGGQESNTMLSSRAEQPLGPMGNAAGFPSQTSSQQPSLQDEQSPNLMAIIQRYPLPSLMAGIALGYLLFSRR